MASRLRWTTGNGLALEIETVLLMNDIKFKQSLKERKSKGGPSIVPMEETKEQNPTKTKDRNQKIHTHTVKPKNTLQQTMTSNTTAGHDDDDDDNVYRQRVKFLIDDGSKVVPSSSSSSSSDTTKEDIKKIVMIPATATASATVSTTDSSGMMKSYDLVGVVDDEKNNNNNDNNDLLQRLSLYLSPYFQLVPKYETVDVDMIKAEVLPVLQRGCSNKDGRGMCPHISWKSMAQSAAEGSIETHTIHIDTDDDEGSSLKLYYDDSAHLKHRPINELAMKLLTKYDKEATDFQIYGDVFVVAVAATATAAGTEKEEEEEERLVSIHPEDLAKLLS